MKKGIVALAAVFFLAVVSGPAFAVTPTPEKTPMVKSMKHSKMHKKTAKRKKTVKPSSTPPRHKIDGDPAPRLLKPGASVFVGIQLF